MYTTCGSLRIKSGSDPGLKGIPVLSSTGGSQNGGGLLNNWQTKETRLPMVRKVKNNKYVFHINFSTRIISDNKNHD